MKRTIFSAIMLMAMLMCSCSKEIEVSHSIFPQDLELKDGDLLFRLGAGLASHAVVHIDSNGCYSHVGIVVDSAGLKMVVHAVPDEPSYKGDKDRVKMERVDEFFMSHKARIGCVMRCNDSVAAHAASLRAMKVYKRGTLFDHDYNDRDSTKMYCCELIEHCYRKSGVALLDDSRHDINIPGLRFSHVILPSDYMKSASLHTVAEF